MRSIPSNGIRDERTVPIGSALDVWLSERGVDASTRSALTALLAGYPAAAAARVPWEEFEPRLLKEYSPTIRSRSTLRGVKHAIRVLKECGLVYVDDLNCEMLTTVVTTRPATLKPRSVAGLLRCISAISTHAVNMGLLPFSPFARRPIRSLVRVGKPRHAKHLTKIELRKIREVMLLDVKEKQGWALYRARRTLALFDLISMTGLRKSEALWLQVDHVDFSAGVINVVSQPGHSLKTEKSEQPVPLIPLLAERLRDYLAHRLDAPEGFTRAPSPYLFPNIRTGSPWISGSVGATALGRFKSAARRAGVPHATLQMVRRAVGTHLEAAGAGAAMISRILRHSPEVDETFYRKADIANMQAAMANYSL